nr:unnamed protein product [Callosobruchus analis]
MAKHPDTASNPNTNRCIHCSRTFKSTQSLDDHIVKRHPDFMASVSSKVHECTKCTYKTVSTSLLRRHMVNHRDVAGNRKTNRCIYCNNTFARKLTLDDHIVKIHPDFIASVNSKVHDCSKCMYKTVRASHLKRHIVAKHSDTANQSSASSFDNTFTRKAGLDDHIIKVHPDFIASVSSKVHKCSDCTYKTIRPSHLKRHIGAKHPDIAGNREIYRCIYCNKTFTRKPSLDDHIVKIHPDFVTSVSSKVHECTECTYKTVSTSLLRRHNTVNHPDAAGNRITNRCTYCKKTFARKSSLDDHVVRRHPDFIASVSSKVHQCTKCTFKTINTTDLKKHITAKHPDIAGNRTIKICIYCNKTFKSTRSLDDHKIKRHHDFITSVSSKVHGCTECTYKTVSTSKVTLDDHIVKRHPDFIASVSGKVYECAKCTFKTVSASQLKRHLVDKHPDTAVRCICDKPFTRKEALDDHIVKTHPDFTSSFSSKVRECSKCTYKTIRPSHLKRHIAAKHPDIPGNRKTNRCIYCNMTFTSTQSLDDHILKIHPDFITSVSSKVHQCTECTYKTIRISHFKRHIVAKHTDVASVSCKVHECIKCTYKTIRHIDLKKHIAAKHPDIAGNRTTNRCIYCNKTFKSTRSLDNHIVKKHPDFITSISRKVHECTECTYKTVGAYLLRRHNMVNHPDVVRRCVYCNSTFTRKVTLDDHIVKRHPDFIATISSKVHECTECTFKTVSTSQLKRHIVAKHPDTAGNRNRKTNKCIYCNKTFKSTQSLDDHVVKIHPDFITSVSSKVHECTECTYKSVSTTLLKQHATAKHPDIAGNGKTNRCIHCNKTLSSKMSLDDHIVNELKKHIMAKHPDISGTSATNRCIYCNKTFKRKRSLDDHIVKIHPDFITSVSRKVHECTECAYKTVSAYLLRRHNMVSHSDVAGNRITNTCIYCNKTFKSTQSLDDHVIKIHPDFIRSVSSKVHECTECTYRTVSTTLLKQHVTAKHPDTAGNRKTNKCFYCNKTFKSTQSLDDHVVKIHPDFITSVSSKVHECTECIYKSVSTTLFKQHVTSKHPDIAGNFKTNRCIYCNKTLSNDHIVKIHPDFITSVSSKVHECKECTYRTVSTTLLKQHVTAKHPDIAGNRKTNRCIYCNKTFKSTQSLNDHIVKMHPDFITSVNSKVHECTECTYKSVSTTLLKHHVTAKHPDIAGNRR